MVLFSSWLEDSEVMSCVRFSVLVCFGLLGLSGGGAVQLLAGGFRVHVVG